MCRTRKNIFTGDYNLSDRPKTHLDESFVSYFQRVNESKVWIKIKNYVILLEGKMHCQGTVISSVLSLCNKNLKQDQCYSSMLQLSII